MRKGALVVLALLVLLPAQVLSQELQGRVLVVEGGTEVAATGATVTVTCPGQETKTVRADSYGFYRLVDSALSGWCAVQVRYQDIPSNRISIKVAGSRTTAVLRLEHSQSGWILRRVAS